MWGNLVLDSLELIFYYQSQSERLGKGVVVRYLFCREPVVGANR